MRRFVENRWLAGGITLVARHERLVHHECFGWMDVERNVPMRPDALFRIYSMTKPITSVAVLSLYEQGAFMLDDPLHAYLPEFATVKVRQAGPDGAEELVPPRRALTIHDLLTHTGGLTYEYVHEAAAAGRTLAEFVPEYCQRPLACHPGERWVYGASHDVLGRLVEVASGQSLDVFLQERIFGPLGMVDTGFWVPEEKRARLCALYTNEPGQTTIVRQVEPEGAFLRPPAFLSGGGGLVSSTADYLRFASMLLHDGALAGVRVLGRKTVELMRQDHLPPDMGCIQPYKFGYGLGVSVLRSLAEKQGIGSVGEFGWGGAASTEFWVDPQEDMITMVMLQLMPKHAMGLTKKIKDAVYQALT